MMTGIGQVLLGTDFCTRHECNYTFIVFELIDGGKFSSGIYL